MSPENSCFIFYAAYIHPSVPPGTSNHVYSHSKQIFYVRIPCEGLIQNCSKAHIFSDPRSFAININVQNVAIASTDPIMVRSSEASSLASARATHGELERFAECFDILISERTFWCREWSHRYYSHACHTTLMDNSTAICFWDVYYSCSFCFTKVYRKLIKITTNSFSFPQVQVINSSQKPSKLLIRWIYGRYYCAWLPEYSLRGTISTRR